MASGEQTNVQATCRCGKAIALGTDGQWRHIKMVFDCRLAEPAASSAIEVAPQEEEMCNECGHPRKDHGDGMEPACGWETCLCKAYRPSVAPGEQNLISSQGEGEVGGSVPQNLPELIGGPVRPRVAKKLSHSQDKTHSRNAEETLKPTPTSPVAPGEREEWVPMDCPACGSCDTALNGRDDKRWIECRRCEHGGPEARTKDEAIALWNLHLVAPGEAQREPPPKEASLDERYRRAKLVEVIAANADRLQPPIPAVPSEAAPSREQRLEDALRKILSLFSDEPKMYLRPCDPNHRMTYGDSDRVDEAFIAAEKALEAK